MIPSFREYFAGDGMARVGLSDWQCVFANDIDYRKARSLQGQLRRA